MAYMEQVIGEFLIESYENLDGLDRDLLELEKNPHARPVLDRIFRTMHTMKGTCVFLGFSRLEALSHAAEGLLSKLREGEIDLTKDIASLLLKMEDVLRTAVRHIEEHKSESEDDFSALREAVGKAVEEGLRAKLGATASADEAEASGAVGAAGEPKGEAADKGGKRPEGRAAPSGDATIRVDVELLDRLMNLVGELVLTRNQILQFTAGCDDSALLGTSQRLNIITTELQEGVMKTRMQPIGNVWNKFPRIVRDLSLSCGKKVRVEMEGQDTELDKTIIEAIKDPLTHIIRNAVDHGIEAPDIRRQNGKEEEGVLLLRAYHEGGQVNIEIADDGRGVDPERVKAKAAEKGLYTRDALARMTDREVANLVFLPGFSTAEKVTNLSGRGVGMDVVKSNLEKIGGSVDLQSEIGHGTTLKIKIPLTLAIIPALVVAAAGECFAIPQLNVLELVRLEGEEARRGVEMVHGAPVFRLRGRILPLVHLRRELDRSRKWEPLVQESADGSSRVYIAVLQAESRQFGLVVEEIFDTEEIVVKPLGRQLKRVEVFAGATIMGDGKVALILDVVGLAERSGVMSQGHSRGQAEGLNEVVREESRGARGDSLLIVMAGERRVAIPLDVVARLEEFSAGCIEHSGGRRVVQYRGAIMPLLDLAEVLGLEGRCAGVRDEEKIDVVVCACGNRQVGVVVDQIVDIVEELVVLKESGHQGGTRGSAVLQGKVTELLDVGSVVEAAGGAES